MLLLVANAEGVANGPNADQFTQLMVQVSAETV